MSAPYDHHFIPAFYLGQWCNPAKGNKLIEYSIKYSKLVAKPVGRKATGFQRHLYTFPELSPDQAQFMEQRFFDYRTGSQPMRYRCFSPAIADGPQKHGADGRGLLLGYTFAILTRSRNYVPLRRLANGVARAMSSDSTNSLGARATRLRSMSTSPRTRL
jgi:hypothetical protein